MERRQGGAERRVQKKYRAVRLPGFFDVKALKVQIAGPVES
jgi:hypothetical protein